MAEFSARFKSLRQDWVTPDGLFRAVDALYQFDFDLAASPANAKCARFFTAKDDALRQKWSGRCWLNPPYGDGSAPLSAWVKKAFAESSADSSMFVVMLIPARTNTRWFHDYCMRAHTIHLLCGRPKFGDAPHGLPLPLCLVEFRFELGRVGPPRFCSFFV